MGSVEMAAYLYFKGTPDCSNEQKIIKLTLSLKVDAEEWKNLFFTWAQDVQFKDDILAFSRFKNNIEKGKTPFLERKTPNVEDDYSNEPLNEDKHEHNYIGPSSSNQMLKENYKPIWNLYSSFTNGHSDIQIDLSSLEFLFNTTIPAFNRNKTSIEIIILRLLNNIKNLNNCDLLKEYFSIEFPCLAFLVFYAWPNFEIDASILPQDEVQGINDDDMLLSSEVLMLILYIQKIIENEKKHTNKPL